MRRLARSAILAAVIVAALALLADGTLVKTNRVDTSKLASKKMTGGISQQPITAKSRRETELNVASGGLGDCESYHQGLSLIS